MERVVIIIPARFASTRFPGKPLVDISGKSMIQRVVEQASKVENAEVIAATDDQTIFDHVNEFGKAVLTPEMNSGTDRCAWVAQHLGITTGIIINLQGDEPFIMPQQIEQLIKLLTVKDVNIATLCKKIDETEELFNHNVVKVTFDKYNRALYFSRNCIPHLRGTEQADYLFHHSFFRHIGIYGFRAETLSKLAKLETSPLEKAESLEQLRWLENGYDIYVSSTDFQSPAVDTPDDLKRVENFLKRNPHLR